MPEGDILEGGDGVAAEEAGEAGDALALLGVALVGHRGRAGLPLRERFLDLEHFCALEVADLGGELIEAAGDESEGRDVVGVTIAVDDLR